AFKKSFLMQGYSFSGEKHFLQPLGGLFSEEKGRFFRGLGGKRQELKNRQGSAYLKELTDYLLI
ncbi:MAG: hypothetical protein EBR01_13595, partial [Proteobacteria bacterium]|nr:hypothetical protein [Pseudomonadota bacterium]